MILATGTTTRSRQHAAFFAALVLLCAPVSPAWAQGGSSGNGGGGNNTQVQMPEPPTVTEPGQAKPLDRQKSSAAAKAMALGGAAMSNVMCMMMMSQAMEEQDRTAKAMMMMAAQQACAQGAEMAKSAMENDKGQKLASGEDVPKQSTLTAKGMQLPTGAPKEEKVQAFIPRTVTTDEGPKPDDIPTSTLAMPDLSVFEKPKPQVAAAAPQPEPTKALKLTPEEPTTTLQPIANKLGFDDSAKRENGSNGASTSKNGLVNLGPGNLTAGSGGNSKGGDEPGRPTVAEAGEAPSGRRGRGVEKGEEGSGGGGDSGGGSREGGDPFEAMLAQLLGGPPGEGGPLSQDGEVTTLPRRADNAKSAPNIFEYATFRYHKLTFEAGRVRTRSTPRQQLPAITSVAKASKP